MDFDLFLADIETDTKEGEGISPQMSVFPDGNDMALEYQKNWLRDEAKVKVGIKSRRIGLTWIEACDAVLIAGRSREAGGSDYLYISTKIDLAREFIDICSMWCLHFNPYERIPVTECLVRDEKKDIKAFRIDLASGFTIYALSSRPSNMRGMQGTVCIDEAAHQEKLKELIKAAMAMRIWGSKVRIISTHNGELNEFNQLIKDIKAGRKNYSLHSVDINQALDDGLYKRICLYTGDVWSEENQINWLNELVADYGEGAAEELFCQPSVNQGQYFSEDMIREVCSDDYVVIRLNCDKNFILRPKHEQVKLIANWLNKRVEPVINSLIKANYTTYAGLDFGRKNDLTVLSILVETLQKDKFVPLVLQLRNCPFHCQIIICRHVFRLFKKFKKACFDATGNGSYLAEEMALEFGNRRIEQVTMSQEVYLSRFPPYKSAIQGKGLCIPNDEDIISDHLAVEYVNGVPKIPTSVEYKGEDKLPRHGDSAISLMLAWSALPRKQKVVKVIRDPQSFYRFDLIDA